MTPILHLPPHSILLAHWSGEVAPCNTPAGDAVVGLSDRFVDMREVVERLVKLEEVRKDEQIWDLYGS